MTTLETRYRRLLAWFPRDHRDTHEEEMLGVLMADARPGQGRPDLHDTLDVVLAGLRMRLRRALGAGAADWRDASTVAGVIGAILTMGWLANTLWWTAHGFVQPGHLLKLAMAVVVVVAAAVNRRWMVVAAAWCVVLLPFTFGVRTESGARELAYLWPWQVGWDEQVLLALATAILFTIGGRTPRRGFALLGTRATAGVVVLGGVLGWRERMDVGDPSLYPYIWALPALLTLAIAAGQVRSSIGRRVVVLLGVPALLLAFPAMLRSLLSQPAGVAVMLLLIGSLALLFGRYLLARPEQRSPVREPRV